MRKNSMIEFMKKHTITILEPKLTKTLYSASSENQIFWSNILLKTLPKLQAACTVLQVLLYHCMLNPIEIIWRKRWSNIVGNKTSIPINHQKCWIRFMKFAAQKFHEKLGIICHKGRRKVEKNWSHGIVQLFLLPNRPPPPRRRLPFFKRGDWPYQKSQEKGGWKNCWRVGRS